MYIMTLIPDLLLHLRILIFSFLRDNNIYSLPIFRDEETTKSELAGFGKTFYLAVLV